MFYSLWFVLEFHKRLLSEAFAKNMSKMQESESIFLKSK